MGACFGIAAGAFAAGAIDVSAAAVSAALLTWPAILPLLLILVPLAACRGRAGVPYVLMTLSAIAAVLLLLSDLGDGHDAVLLWVLLLPFLGGLLGCAFAEKGTFGKRVSQALAPADTQDEAPADTQDEAPADDKEAPAGAKDEASAQKAIAAAAMAKANDDLLRMSAIYRGSWGPLVADWLSALLRPDVWASKRACRRMALIGAILLVPASLTIVAPLVSAFGLGPARTVLDCDRPKSGSRFLVEEERAGIKRRVYLCGESTSRGITNAELFGNPLGFGLALVLWPIFITLPSRGERARRFGVVSGPAVNEPLVVGIMYCEVLILVGFFVGIDSWSEGVAGVLWGLAVASMAHFGSLVVASLLDGHQGGPIYGKYPGK